VRAGNTPWACNCAVSFLSSSLFAASCSLAVLESFLNARAGLYRLGLYQCFGLDVPELCPAPGELCAAAASAPNSNPATVTAMAIKCFLICVPLCSFEGLGFALATSRPLFGQSIEALQGRTIPIRYSVPPARGLRRGSSRKTRDEGHASFCRSSPDFYPSVPLLSCPAKMNSYQ